MYLVSVGSGVSIVSVYVSGLVRSWLCVCVKKVCQFQLYSMRR